MVGVGAVEGVVEGVAVGVVEVDVGRVIGGIVDVDKLEIEGEEGCESTCVERCSYASSGMAILPSKMFSEVKSIDLVLAKSASIAASGMCGNTFWRF